LARSKTVGCLALLRHAPDELLWRRPGEQRFLRPGRQKRQQDDPKIFQVYFTGCAGNIAAGKYNDGAKENRPVLRDRMYAGMVAAWKATQRHAIKGWEWRVEPVKLPPRSEKSFGMEESRKILDDLKQPKARRGNAAYQMAWLKRKNRPIELTCLDLGKARSCTCRASRLSSFRSRPATSEG